MKSVGKEEPTPAQPGSAFHFKCSEAVSLRERFQSQSHLVPVYTLTHTAFALCLVTVCICYLDTINELGKTIPANFNQCTLVEKSQTLVVTE